MRSFDAHQRQRGLEQRNAEALEVAGDEEVPLGRA